MIASASELELCKIMAAQTYKSEDFASAMRIVKPIAEQGNMEAQNLTAALYRDGQGVPQNYAEAIKWYRRAANQGHAGAQYNFGLMHASGRGVPMNLIIAYKWLNLSAAQSFENATKVRDLARQYMTSADVDKAQKLGSELVAKKE